VQDLYASSLTLDSSSSLQHNLSHFLVLVSYFLPINCKGIYSETFLANQTKNTKKKKKTIIVGISISQSTSKSNDRSYFVQYY
jgi:hypothetical protein